MMEQNQLAVFQNFDNISKAAIALQKSGYFTDVKSEAQAIVKVMAGAELGLPPFASMAGIHIIQGKPALGSNVIATLVKNDPRYDYRIVSCDNKACVIEWCENGEKVGKSDFTMDDATTAGLTNNPSWKKFPSDMLFARAITRGARRFAPGIFGGSPIYTPEELGVDTDEEGYIDTTHRVINEPSLVETAIDLGGVPSMSMTYETACEVTNSKGTKYGDLTNEELSSMTIGINKGLKKPDLKPELVNEYRLKQDAIKVILQSRQ